MANTFALSKILQVREMEKKNAQKAYHHAMQLFEEAAMKLYKLLKKKEVAEDTYADSLLQPIQIEIIKEQAAYMELLNRQIMKLQHDVQIARAEMETKQSKLTDAHVEVKKFQKIIEFRNKSKADRQRKQEEALMDEVSIQQYLSRIK